MLVAFHTGVPVRISAVPLLIRFSAEMYGKAVDDGLRSWPLLPCADPDGVPGSWLQPGLFCFSRFRE